MEIMVFHEIDDFHERVRLWHSRKVVQSAEKYFFIKNDYSHQIGKSTQIISDLIPDAGDVREHRKPSIFMIFYKNQ